MIMGDVCTRGCRFCATKTGKPLPPNPVEPQQVAESVNLMGLRHVVVTSVTRDDLADGGAAHWAQTVEAIKAKNPNATIELLIPDLDAEPASLEVVMASMPDIIGHNIETVERLTPVVRAPRPGLSWIAAGLPLCICSNWHLPQIFPRLQPHH